MRTLVYLCKPDPGGPKLLNSMRDKLVDLYGHAVDHPDLINAFKFVLAAGGADSPHMKDLADFISVFVKPRKLKMTTW